MTHLPKKRVLGVGVVASLLSAVAMGFYARYVEPHRLQVTNLDFSKKDSSSSINIAFVTDLHVGPHMRPGDFEPTIRALEKASPDIILLGGDFLSESPRYLHDLQAPLTRMAQAARIGCWGIWGNHDLANMRERVEPILEACNVTMLTNAAAKVTDHLWLVGIDDALLGKPNLDQAFASVPVDARTVCLWHEPDLASKVAPRGPVLMLSGHTHGGQVRLPFLGPLATPSLGKQFVAGVYHVDRMPLYVSRGIGMYRPPLRFNCRPELVLIRI